MWNVKKRSVEVEIVRISRPFLYRSTNPGPDVAERFRIEHSRCRSEELCCLIVKACRVDSVRKVYQRVLLRSRSTDEAVVKRFSQQ